MNNMRKSSKKLMPTYFIVALNITVYVYTAMLSGSPIEIHDSVIRQYGQHNSIVLNGGYWQLLSAMFVHVDIAHILGNLFFLFIFGLRAEELFAVQEYVLIYFLSGLAGNMLTLLLGSNVTSAGASGAIFGVFGACTIYIRRTVGRSIIGALVYAFFLLIISSGRNVNNLAHLGGLVVGLLMGYALAGRYNQRITYEYSYSY